MSQDVTRVIEKVRKLLALAAGTHGPEADAALASAHRLMNEYDLDQATITDAEVGSVYSTQLFERLSRITGLETALATVLHRCFHVNLVWSRERREMLAFGRPHHIKVAGYAYVVLSRKFREKWEASRRSTGSDSYFLGMAATVIATLKRGEEPRGLILLEEERRAAFAREFPETGAVEIDVSARAFAHGRRDGQDIRLQTPVGHAPRSTGRIA